MDECTLLPADHHVKLYVSVQDERWGEPTVMFREATDAELLDAARQLPEVRALMVVLRGFRHCDGCFCEAAFAGPSGGHPRHTPECERAQAALAAVEGD